MTTRAHTWAALAIASVLALSACTAEQSAGDTGGGDASCAALLEYDGARYLGHGDLKRAPATSGRTVDAVVPGCDDSGGQDPDPPADEEVRVAELVDVPLETAVLYNGSVYVRDGSKLPDEASRWFTAPDCARRGEFELTGDWIGVTGRHEPRFDGDLRPPYRVELTVERGPEEYVGSTVVLRATARTDPRPGVPEVKASLWDDEPLVATVRCDGDRFSALSLEVRSAD